MLTAITVYDEDSNRIMHVLYATVCSLDLGPALSASSVCICSWNISSVTLLPSCGWRRHSHNNLVNMYWCLLRCNKGNRKQVVTLIAHRTILFNYWHLRRRGEPFNSAVGKPLLLFFFFFFSPKRWCNTEKALFPNKHRSLISDMQDAERISPGQFCMKHTNETGSTFSFVFL